jgi:hypothetical protein
VHVFAHPSSVEPGDLPCLAEKMRSLIDEEAALHQCEEARNIFETAFAGPQTANDALNAAVAWACAAEGLGKVLFHVLSADRAFEARDRIGGVLSAEKLANELLSRVATTAKIDACHFKQGSSCKQIAQRLDDAAHDSDGLFSHALFATALDEVRPHGLLPLVNERLDKDAHLQGLAEQLEAIAVRQLSKAVYANVGSELTKYRGSKLDDLRKSVAEQDREIIRLSRKQLRTKVCTAARPPQGNGLGRKSTWTELALIENEISKKQRFISVRELTQRAGRALLELKPCWMMSPLAVAQYVPKGTIHFDLCIVDEASQMPPESAMGALLRCSQTMVVGDTNQLPPSSFFKSLIDDEEADEDETVLNESILEMANATFRPARRLRWH